MLARNVPQGDVRLFEGLPESGMGGCVRAEGVQPVSRLPPVGEAVPVGVAVGRDGVGPRAELLQVGHPVAVGVKAAIMRKVAKVDDLPFVRHCVAVRRQAKRALRRGHDVVEIRMAADCHLVERRFFTAHSKPLADDDAIDIQVPCPGRIVKFRGAAQPAPPSRNGEDRVREKGRAVRHHGVAASREQEKGRVVPVVVERGRTRKWIFAHIDPHDVGCAGDRMRRACAIDAKRTGPLIDDFGLHGGAFDNAGRRPAMLPRYRAWQDIRRLEGFGKQGEGRRAVGGKGVASPRQFKRIGKPVAVGVRKPGGCPVDMALHAVGEAVPVGVAGGVGGKVEAPAGFRQRVVPQSEQDGVAGMAPQMRPRRRGDAVCPEVQGEEVSRQPAREDVDVGEGAKGIDRHAADARRAGMRGDSRHAPEYEGVERVFVAALAGDEHQRVAQGRRHVRRVASVGVDPTVGRIGRRVVRFA